MFNKDNIENLMNENGWTKYRLAKEANLGQSTVHEILSGKKKTPSAVTLQKLAKALGVSVNAFFDDEYSECNTNETNKITINMISTRLKSLRENADLSQKELAKSLGVSPSTIGMYESKKRTPDSEMLARICDFFNITVDYLLGRSNIKNPQFSTYNKEEQNPITDDEKNILNLYKKLNAKDKAKFEGMMELKISEYEEENKKDKKIISSTCQNIGEEIS
ncbi:helix-turn-helix domain-containing protein [uncultured Clostridium sp.]|uniref:helix-turn-helix domain-containing protein n=1 Tax=uncultured Clostridium sp. TaxID=59620 RepID=UPI00272FE34A|nr:helix-turn-helix domain-containing protein [uncultured Clostridium sp.]